MARLPALFLLLLALLVSAGCGYVAVFGAINPGTQTVIGVVTIVQFQYVNGSASVTVVTLADNGAAQTLPFCGDQRPFFPMNQAVRASFTPGNNCNTLVAVSQN
jgi:hypothetical protein